MLNSLNDWLFWWLDMLRQLFCDGSGRLGEQQSKIIFQQGGLHISTGDKVTQVKSVVELLTLVGNSKFQHNYLKSPVDIQFDTDTAIIRKLTNVSMPESHKSAAAQFDMQASTPFRQSDFYALNVRHEKYVPGAFYAVVKRAELITLLTGLENANLKISSIILEDRGQKFLLTQAALKGLLETKNGFFHQCKVAFFAATLFILPVTFFNYRYQHSAAISQIERSIEPLLVKAKTLRVELDKRAALIAEMQALRNSINESRPAITIWEELSRILPDSSFLTDLTITQDKVSIAGYTQSASAIIVAIEASSIFDEVSFTSPVVKVPGRTDDRFSIDLKIGSN
jgi:general secretion pathway protein L